MSNKNEIPPDVKNDVQLAFDLFKNEKNKVNKLKLRTILFSFVMYSESASKINDFIKSVMGDKELFSFEDVCDLINSKLQESKENDAKELFKYITLTDRRENIDDKENEDEYLKNIKMSKNNLADRFKESNINVDPEEIDKMVKYMLKFENNENNEEENQENAERKKTSKGNSISIDQFKEFYCEKI